MKIIIINGSPRTNGATGRILSRINQCISDMYPDIEIVYVNLAQMNIIPCMGCASCYKTGHCYIKEDGIEALSQAIEECDGVIFGSPTYASNVSGHFKILIDRGHFVFEQLLKNKACFSVVTYENYGGRKARKVINALIRLSGGAVCCQYLVKLNHGDNVLNDKRNEQIRKLSGKFLFRVQQDNPLSLYEKFFGSFAFHVGIKPHVFRNKSRYQGVINRWINQGIISDSDGS